MPTSKPTSSDIAPIEWHYFSAHVQNHGLCRYCPQRGVAMRKSKRGWLLVCVDHRRLTPTQGYVKQFKEKNMDYKRVSTGSAETESELRIFLDAAESLDSGVPRKLFKDDYYWKVMTAGRNGEKDAYPDSTAKDDTGGFFEERDGLVYLTDKAKSCIHIECVDNK